MDAQVWQGISRVGVDPSRHNSLVAMCTDEDKIKSVLNSVSNKGDNHVEIMIVRNVSQTDILSHDLLRILSSSPLRLRLVPRVCGDGENQMS